MDSIFDHSIFDPIIGLNSFSTSLLGICWKRPMTPPHPCNPSSRSSRPNPTGSLPKRLVQERRDPRPEPVDPRRPSLTLPHRQRLPSSRTEQAPDLRIAPPVPLKLGDPILPIRRGRRLALRATVPVPEAAVDEDDFPHLRENQIRRPWQRPIMSSETKTQHSNQPAHDEFRRRALRLHRRHDSRAFVFGESVNHDFISLAGCTDFGSVDAS